MRVPLRRPFRAEERRLERLLFCGLLLVPERALLRWPLLWSERRLERRPERVQKQGLLRVEDSRLLRVL
jgi:hypothetical protein